MSRHYIEISPGEAVDLSAVDPGGGADINKKTAGKQLQDNLRMLERLQERLYAEGKHAMLIILQGMDAAGKDGTIRKVMGSFNPQGVEVTPFKVPTAEEAAHDFLWRIHKRVPRAGMIGIFNRSHYEDVLVVRVRNLSPENVWRARYDQINAFEEILDRRGVLLVKIFLHISPAEQARRMQERIDRPEKNWKFNPGDIEDRKLWWDFEKAYEDALTRCSTKTAPWHIIPADRKWYRNLAVSELLRDRLEEIDPHYPKAVEDISSYTIPEIRRPA